VGQQGEDQPQRAAPRGHGQPPGILATSGRRSARRASTSARPTAARATTGARSTSFTFVCEDLTQQLKVMKALQKVQGVVAVERA
jgi:hypothetical protein